MGVLFVGGLLIGIFLGRFFKVLVLVPAGFLGIFLICVRSGDLGENFLFIMGEAVVLMTSLQTGYILSALTRGAAEGRGVKIVESRVAPMHPRSAVVSTSSLASERRKSWVEAASAALRSVHLR